MASTKRALAETVTIPKHNKLLVTDAARLSRTTKSVFVTPRHATRRDQMSDFALVHAGALRPAPPGLARLNSTARMMQTTAPRKAGCWMSLRLLRNRQTDELTLMPLGQAYPGCVVYTEIELAFRAPSAVAWGLSLHRTRDKSCRACDRPTRRRPRVASFYHRGRLLSPPRRTRNCLLQTP